MLILGIDPGTAMIGVGLIEYKNKQVALRCYDCLKTSQTDGTAERLNDLHQKLNRFIKKHQPDVIAVEDIFFFKNLKTAVKVSQARGVILLAAAQHRAKIYEYTPLQVKQAITGYGRAEKKQVQQMVKTILKLKEIPRPDDAADALAVAICCTHSIRS
ncbi:MAG TPA: crossover junction endodeoxyribonuclease RuvC [Candidatus Portnoybacteria bacterium]|uniref:Crossover junction endodeoxyribonuclease RuvC n=1 Tax=Candidatus Portnoybacteria bacterium CG02_land_8_20_14_3_00_45_8 TaxID=1974807 RepID=A0A2M7D6K1_9BACT|nr:MAG: crossover junction endodeoxyribonuclease RuvC [Candidatus Portnoybacteria bacterium CG02_land_8_20_14_3_00_45_8]HCX27891.1 crossover junction endodeoxyribonuclease RuvC [Candidatus Portnoybacteria bacterium]